MWIYFLYILIVLILYWNQRTLQCLSIFRSTSSRFSLNFIWIFPQKLSNLSLKFNLSMFKIVFIPWTKIVPSIILVIIEGINNIEMSVVNGRSFIIVLFSNKHLIALVASLMNRLPRKTNNRIRVSTGLITQPLSHVSRIHCHSDLLLTERTLISTLLRSYH